MCQSLEQTKESRPSLTYTPCNRPENHPKPQQHFGFTRLSLIASPQICLPWHGGVDAGSDIRTLLYVDVSTFFFTRLALTLELCQWHKSTCTTASLVNLTGWSVTTTSPWQYSKGDIHYVANAAQAAKITVRPVKV